MQEIYESTKTCGHFVYTGFSNAKECINYMLSSLPKATETREFAQSKTKVHVHIFPLSEDGLTEHDCVEKSRQVNGEKCLNRSGGNRKKAGFLYIAVFADKDDDQN